MRQVAEWLDAIGLAKYQTVFADNEIDWSLLPKLTEAERSSARPIKAPTPPENPLERRYALRAVKQRLHQASFREAVITAYKRAVRIA
jgi:hypothetical protein